MKNILSDEAREFLKPLATAFQQAVVQLGFMDDAKLTEAKGFCAAAMETNCGWDEYAAATFIGDEIESEQRYRAASPGTRPLTRLTKAGD